MSRKSTKKNPPPQTAAPVANAQTPTPAPNPESEAVAVGGWRERARPARRPFPGPRLPGVALRVAFDAAAYAELIVHAKQSLDAEICGVLAGRICEDDDGPFVHVEAAVRGERAKEGSAHVTYTQETWNAVHATLERDYPQLSIVGWYHSHPGFGVEFSDMDRFIQQNFFSGPCQVGFVTDPLSGDVALCHNAADGIKYLDRCAIDGREQRCRTPVDSRGHAAGPAGAANDSLELRLTQLVQAVDDLRTALYRWLTLLGMAAAMVVALFIARQIYQLAFGSVPEIPQNIGFAGVPVSIEGKACMLGVQVVKWQVPPELWAVPPEVLERLAKEREAAEAEKQTQDKPQARDREHGTDK